MSNLTVAEHEALGMSKRLAKIQIDNSLTKREQLAAMALQGLLSAEHNANKDPDEMVNIAFVYADRILKQSKIKSD